MAREEVVRRTLGLGETDVLDERGVFHAPPASELVEPPPGRDVLGPGEVLLSREWLSDRELEERFSPDEVLTAAMTRGSVKRLDVEPRVIVLENIPSPTLRFGAVSETPRGAWILDTRVGPAALSVPVSDHELLMWAEAGDVRLYALRRGTRPV